MLLLSLTVSEAALNNPIVCVAQNIEMKFILFCFIGTAEEGDLKQFRPSVHQSNHFHWQVSFGTFWPDFLFDCTEFD